MATKRNNILINIVSNLLLQFLTVVSSFIIPRVMLSYFGSETNGLVSSLTQFLAYINIAEGGIGGVIIARLYKPLVDRDAKQTSRIIIAAKKIYKRLGCILITYSMILSILYPLFAKSSFSYSYISTMVYIIALQIFIQYIYSASYQQLLKADKKIYIVSLVQSLVTVLNICIFTIVSKIYPNIHVLKLLMGLTYLAQPLVYNHYIKKNYSLDQNETEDKKLIKNKWDGFAINIADFVHSCTDITVLTIFVNLITVSIYTVYATVTNGARKILQAIFSAISSNIGHIYAKGNVEALREKFNTVELVYLMVTSYFFTVTGLLIVPFVSVYAGGIVDANYYQPVFATILVIAEYIYCLREPYYCLAQAAERFRDMKKHAYIEAGLNLSISIPLVILMGLPGVAIGTLIGNTYRTLYHVIYLRNNILYRSPKRFIIAIMAFGFATVLSVITCLSFFPGIESGIVFFVNRALIYATITALFYTIVSLTFFRNELIVLIKGRQVK